jgi:hypothetical protein
MFFLSKKFLHFVPHYYNLSWREKLPSKCYVNLESLLWLYSHHLFTLCVTVTALILMPLWLWRQFYAYISLFLAGLVFPLTTVSFACCWGGGKCTGCASRLGLWVGRYEKCEAVVAIALWEEEVVLHYKAYDRIPIVFCFQKTGHDKN